MQFIESLKAAALLCALAILGACGGGGGGGGSSSSSNSSSDSVSGVTLPSEVSVITSSSSSSDSVSGVQIRYDSVSGVITSQSFASSTHYESDETEFYVFDESMEGVETVNFLLCLMDQTGAANMVNEGAYVALVDEDKCEQGSNQSTSGSTGQSSGGNVKQLKRWIVTSTRASNSVPMYVNAWVTGIEGPNDSRMNILVEVEAREGISDEKPFGDFTMNFRGVSAQDNTSVTMEGTLKTVFDDQSQLKFSYINLSGNQAPNAPDGLPFGFSEKAFVVLDDASGTSGVAHTAGFAGNEYFLAFDPLYVLREKASSPGTPDSSTAVCLDRNDVSSHVWRYGLYHRDAGTFRGNEVSSGQRVKLRSGFPFRYTDGDTERHGYVSYWGLWAEGANGGEGTIADGTTIEKQTFSQSGSSAQNYTVNISPGRLMRRTASSLGISKLLGQRLIYWGPDPRDANQHGQWTVEVDSSSFAFKAIGSMEFGEQGPTTTNFETPVDITPSTDGETLTLWSDGLGGNINYIHDSAVEAANRTVTFYGQETVFPGDATLFAGGSSVTLYCYDRCLKGGLSQTDIDNAQGHDSLYHPTQSTPYAYTLSHSGGKLSLLDGDGNAVDFSALNASSLGNEWGVQSGEMVTSTDGIEQPWDVYSQSTSYRWESGRNNWNRLVTVSDSNGDIASFDKPLQFTYTLEANDELNSDTDHVGKVFLLEYRGNGDLGGFPFEQEGACGPGEEGHCRWYPLVALKKGVELTDADNNVFVLKPREGEQTFNEVAVSSCTSPHGDNSEGLNSGGAAALALPSTIDAAVSITWGEKPTPSDPAPAVIEGELQSSSSE